MDQSPSQMGITAEIPSWKNYHKVFSTLFDENHDQRSNSLHLEVVLMFCVVTNSFCLIKVHMTWKIFSAFLKGLSKYRRMAFFFLKYLFSFERYWRFSIMQIRSVMTSYCLQLKMVKYWINDISGNIKAVFLKLGTINMHHRRNKMTPSMALP